MVGTYNSVARRKIEIGKKYGRMTVLKFSGRNQHGNLEWKCRCDCGKLKICLGSNLLNGTNPSCGCYAREVLIARNKTEKQKNYIRGNKFSQTHGGRYKVEYSIWRGIMSRCYTPSHRLYPRYGGRGLTVHKRWHKFENFYKDMGDRPNGKYSIERKNNDKGYSPGNVVWATDTEQNRNRSNTIRVSYRGKLTTLAALAEKHGIRLETLRKRIDYYGFTLKEALTRPVRKLKGVNS